jgi:hypothetical protein
MNMRSLNILFSDRTLLVMSAAIIAAFIFTLVSFMYAGILKDRNERLNSQIERLTTIGNDVVKLQAAVNSKEQKIIRKRPAGVVSTLEQILKDTDLEARMIKPLGKKKIKEYIEENAELEIMGADLNSIVNLLYIIDTSGVPMKIKNASIKTTFEDPDMFILKLTVSGLSKG